MMYQTADSSGFLLGMGGATALGGALGYAAKKVVKLVAVIVGLQLGFLALLEQQGIMTMNWEEVGNWMDGTASDVGPQLVDILLSTGLAGGGFAGGFMVGYRKG